MKIFRVVVRGYCKMEGHETARETAILDFLLDAHSADEAWVAGPQVAETVAQFGPKWAGFESVQVSPIAFPYMLSDTTSQRTIPE
jgi:hypothetical protein